MFFLKTNYNRKYIKIKDLKKSVNIEDLHVNIEDLDLNDELFFGLLSVIVMPRSMSCHGRRFS